MSENRGPFASGPENADEGSLPAPIITTGQGSIAARLCYLFDSYEHKHGRFKVTPQKESGKVEGEASTLDGPTSPELWQLHLDGELGLGAIPIKSNGACRWGAIDIDVYADLDPCRIAAQIAAWRLPAIAGRSKSGGAHVYLWCNADVPAPLFRQRLAEISKGLSYPDAERFPKQDRPTDAGGSWINLPYFQGNSTTRYAVMPSGDTYSLVEFVDAAERLKAATGPDWFSTPLSLPSAPEPGTSKGGRKACFTLPDGVINDGERNKTLTSMAGTMRRVGASQDVIVAALHQLNQQCDPPLSDADVERIAKSVARYQPKSALTTFPLTEMGNAERFSTEHGDNLRYCAAQKQWLVWDGRRWEPDGDPDSEVPGHETGP